MSNHEINPFKEVEFPPEIKPQRSKFRLVKIWGKSTYSVIRKIAPITSVLALIATSVGIYLGYPIYKNYNYTNPANDGYVAPRSPGDIVDLVTASVVQVNCEINKNEFWYGSGWSIDLRPSSKKYNSSIITNHHVIEDCIKSKGKVTVMDFDGKEYEAAIDKYDVENDLAKLSTTLKIKPLGLSQNPPWPGYWVMTAGNPDQFQGSVSFGSVMNVTETEVLITANISHGNSGGPLVDNEGFVIGTNSWGRNGEQYNGAKSLDAMCVKIIKCKYNNGKYYWNA